ncbi:ORF MSV206 putative glycosyl transferase, similar to Haemophilus somnus GB:U20824 [Melanoplus sanguinipes entomopoxvirus]|uniref:ORF MSV206 putative glycosyl transferase, similar to Haemophilus somnus GB:U20824 n=1 Tax=Melanoplus sanguinipes entomopoxvirus TaxID=83191 RepID=Q9YVN6_MSEPV|nr:ORF MSV206 putative glycosyl transferase, similar to Haemophilus somnus GB:U20824 [Melanoplus sanguinipes entomopoxvirus]AAC97755.1 ORF MSV206 putative glycosyl transferase, similar to Haemophilus somnus GB:U20824 [Melanoplus sanguinipes entomopoxvirus 'O']
MNIRYHIIVLTIKRNKQRQKDIINYMNAQKYNNYSFFYGIDYKQNKDNVKYVARHIFKQISPYGVMACAASHILLWKFIASLESKYDFVIVLEDDTIINIDKLNKYIDYIYNLTKTGFTFLYSDYCLGWDSKIIIDKECTIIKNPMINMSLGAYALTSNIAKIISDYYIEYKVWFHIDVQLSLDIVNYMNISSYILCVNKMIVQPSGYNSSMGLKHNSLFLYSINNTTMYRLLTTPFFRIKELEFDAYTVAILIILLILLLYNSLTVFSIILFFLIIYEMILIYISG